MYSNKQTNQGNSMMTEMTINNAPLGMLHTFSIMSGDRYPFVSISVNGEEVGHIDIEEGLSIHRYVVMPAFKAAGKSFTDTFVELVVHVDGRYDYVQICDMHGNEMHCHEMKKVVS